MADYKSIRGGYERKMKPDPPPCLQVCGQSAMIHLDPTIASVVESPATMMPWQDNTSIMIDRFDMRAHLDVIPECEPTADFPKLSHEELTDDRKACYERYDTLIQHDFLGLNEGEVMRQVDHEEKFGPVLKSAGGEEKKKLINKSATVGSVYKDGTEYPMLPAHSSKDEEKYDLSEIDLDVSIDVSELTKAQRMKINDHSLKYGRVDGDIIKSTSSYSKSQLESCSSCPTKSHSRSQSRSMKKSEYLQLPPPPKKWYYRRQLSFSSNKQSDDSDTHDGKKGSSSEKKWQQLMDKAEPVIKKKWKPQEMLKRKLQIALMRQYKADKKKKRKKAEKERKEKSDQAEELRILALKLRQKRENRRSRSHSSSSSTYTN